MNIIELDNGVYKITYSNFIFKRNEAIGTPGSWYHIVGGKAGGRIGPKLTLKLDDMFQRTHGHKFNPYVSLIEKDK